MSQSGSRILDPVLKGVEPLLQKESGLASLGAKSGAIFEWSGSDFYELSCWILLVEQSAQKPFMTFSHKFILANFKF